MSQLSNSTKSTEPAATTNVEAIADALSLFTNVKAKKRPAAADGDGKVLKKPAVQKPEVLKKPAVQKPAVLKKPAVQKQASAAKSVGVGRRPPYPGAPSDHNNVSTKFYVGDVGWMIYTDIKARAYRARKMGEKPDHRESWKKQTPFSAWNAAVQWCIDH